ncbi:MAG: transposase, partial [Minisyncoccia bacterium]
NLHASIAIEGHDRKALERILRYMGRPPLSNDRLSLAPDGHRLIVTLKTPWRDGTSQIILTPFELLERLTAIIPPPRKNLIRYHGCFGPNSKIRGHVVKSASIDKQEPKGNRIARINFARLMARIFGEDVLACPKCQGKLKVISFIIDKKPIREILKSLKMPTAPPQNQAEASRYVEYDDDHRAGQNYLDE